MMQNWISFMPISSASGLSSGARITMFGVVSITQPAAIRIAIISRISSVGSSVSEVTAATKPCGTPSAAMVCASGSEKAMIGRITPFTLADDTIIAGKSDSLSVPITKPMKMVTTTAVAPASVGVSWPEKMPQKITPGTMNAYQPRPSAPSRFAPHSLKVISPPPS